MWIRQAILNPVKDVTPKQQTKHLIKTGKTGWGIKQF